MLQLLRTKDNSFTLYNPVLDETYHSRNGALQESLYVFIKQGLHHYIEKTNAKEINILEVGFGTGLNALLTYLEFEKLNIKTNYYSLEPYPIPKEIADQLEYPTILSLNKEEQTTFYQMHEGFFFKETNGVSFQFKLLKDSFAETDLETHFDLIYFDAFAPDKQPDLWTKAVFEKCNELLKPSGIWVTYCAKGEVKRNLKNVGFKVETLPGPPGKREMIRAVKVD
ncbi:MAG: tRNA (5-methylaminomethyl-2-thiouridine)(34)-methyltransferase MnmD [Bacteroidota bacterium]|nr:tRNA (5-methylaminomethyl-2-thiouridine)(34)-methyltransferase MnmD [Bacteroidota bacterium]